MFFLAVALFCPEKDMAGTTLFRDLVDGIVFCVIGLNIAVAYRDLFAQLSEVVCQVPEFELRF